MACVRFHSSYYISTVIPFLFPPFWTGNTVPNALAKPLVRSFPLTDEASRPGAQKAAVWRALARLEDIHSGWIPTGTMRLTSGLS